MGKNSRTRNQAAARLPGEPTPMRLAPILISALLANVITSLGFMAAHRHREARKQADPVVTPQASAAGALIDCLLEIPRVPANSVIAFLNLATAPGLPPQQRPGMIEDGLKTLNIWPPVTVLRLRQTHDPMDPTPRIPMPGQYQPNHPQSAFPQPNTGLNPAFTPPSHPYALR
jgi:hypothetical protein